MQERRFGFPAKAVAFRLLNGLSAIGPGLCARVLVQGFTVFRGCGAAAFPPERVVAFLWWVYSFLFVEHSGGFYTKVSSP